MFVETIVLGAGPAGIQLGALFEKQKIPYLILEKAAQAGSFFQNFPLSGKLISINKPNTGSDKADFNMRHDWNSLLSDKHLLFQEFSQDYYPSREDLAKYLQKFAKEHALKIQYESTVQTVRKKDNRYVLTVLHNSVVTEYTCEKLIVATGLSKRNMPDFTINVQQPIKHYGEYDKDAFLDPKELAKYKNKSVILFGSGNAAYELANILTPIASSVSIVGRTQKKWAMSTHYVGDLRSVYFPFVDTFLLKSLNSFSDGLKPEVLIDQEQEDGPYFVSGKDTKEAPKRPFFTETTSVFDHVLFCTGWKFDPSLFQFPIDLVLGDKYPNIQTNYESTNQPNLFFVGSLGHSLDYKRSSGGFIHGFRYLLTHFMNMNYKLPYEITYFAQGGEQDPLQDLVFHIMEKINSSSPMYQMYGQICDFYVFDGKQKKIVYYNNVHIRMITEGILPLEDNLGFVLTLEYGNDQVTDIRKLGTKISKVGTECLSTLLHPVLRVIQPDLTYVDIIHFDEDLFANFTKPETYLFKLVRVIKSFL